MNFRRKPDQISKEKHETAVDDSVVEILGWAVKLQQSIHLRTKSLNHIKGNVFNDQKSFRNSLLAKIGGAWHTLLWSERSQWLGFTMSPFNTWACNTGKVFSSFSPLIVLNVPPSFPRFTLQKSNAVALRRKGHKSNKEDIHYSAYIRRCPWGNSSKYSTYIRLIGEDVAINFRVQTA